jgi:FxsC-like protein
MPFQFFFSYARENRGKELDRFRAKLFEQIKLRRYFPKDQIGFFDGKDIEAGAPWKQTLGDALRTSRVFLAICSPDYINSEYCGKEFQVFLERYHEYEQSARPEKKPRLILPILWGDPKGSLRDVISEFQYTDDRYPAVYAQEGLFRMMQQRKHADAFRQFVSRLADRIVESADADPMPDLATLRSLDDVPSAFHTAAASDSAAGDRAWFAFVAGKAADFNPPRTSTARYQARGGRDWKPFSPASNQTVGIVAQTVASQYERYFAGLPVDGPRFIENIQNTTSEPVFVVVDAWSLRLPRFRDLMRTLDRTLTDTCALIIPWNSPDAETDQYRDDLKAQILDVFRYRAEIGRRLHYWGDVDSAEGLRDLLLKMMAFYTNRMIETHQTPAPKKIDNPEVQASIEEKGLALERPPGVKSPSGASGG